MVAIGLRLYGPQLPDQAAFDKDLVHLGSPLCLLLRLRFPSKRIPSSKRRASGFPICAMQHLMIRWRPQDQMRSNCSLLGHTLNLSVNALLAGHEKAHADY